MGKRREEEEGIRKEKKVLPRKRKVKKVKRTLLFLAFPSSLSYPAGIDT